MWRGYWVQRGRSSAVDGDTMHHSRQQNSLLCCIVSCSHSMSFRIIAFHRMTRNVPPVITDNAMLMRYQIWPTTYMFSHVTAAVSSVSSFVFRFFSLPLTINILATIVCYLILSICSRVRSNGTHEVSKRILKDSIFTKLQPYEWSGEMSLGAVKVK